MKKLLYSADAWSATDRPDLPAERLFAGASAAVLVVEHTTGRVAEANPAALQLLGTTQAQLVGKGWLDAFDQPGGQRLAEACQHAWVSPAAIEVEAANRAEGRLLGVALSTFRVAHDSYLLVRLSPGSAQAGAAAAPGNVDVLEQLDQMPTAFVVTDGGLCADYANQAFVELVQANSRTAVLGRSLAQWLALTEADVLRLREQMQRRQAASMLVTTLRTGPWAGQAVEITAIGVPDAPEPCWGFALRVLANHDGNRRVRRTDG
jgi:PAS domain S-box-containing protein